MIQATSNRISAQLWFVVTFLLLSSCSITTNVVVSKDVVTVNAHGEVSEKVLKILWFLP